MKMQLVQRMSFREITPERLANLYGRDPALLHPDYMGSAEFEFGAVGNSFRRILERIDQYDDYTIIPLGIMNKNLVPFWIYCRKDKIDEVRECLMNYIENPYHLKESIGFLDKVNSIKNFTGDNFWFDITNDFMFFIGAADRVAAFRKCMYNHTNKEEV